jgi:hypothetical protein
MSWRVEKVRTWNVKAPGGREWTGAPSQPVAFNLARSLAAIDTMLATIHRPALAAVRGDGVVQYGCYRMPVKAH